MPDCNADLHADEILGAVRAACCLGQPACFPKVCSQTKHSSGHLDMAAPAAVLELACTQPCRGSTCSPLLGVICCWLALACSFQVRFCLVLGCSQQGKDETPNWRPRKQKAQGLVTVDIYSPNLHPAWHGHTNQKPPDPVRSRKLTWFGQDQYYVEESHGNPLYCAFAPPASVSILCRAFWLLGQAVPCCCPCATEES